MSAPCRAAGLLNQRAKDYSMGDVASRWNIGHTEVCAANAMHWMLSAATGWNESPFACDACQIVKFDVETGKHRLTAVNPKFA